MPLLFGDAQFFERPLEVVVFATRKHRKLLTQPFHLFHRGSLTDRERGRARPEFEKGVILYEIPLEDRVVNCVITHLLDKAMAGCLFPRGVALLAKPLAKALPAVEGIALAHISHSS